MSLLDQVRKASHKAVLEARLNISMKDVEHLVTWCRDTGRTYLILKAEDLVRGLTLSHLPLLQAMLADYARSRARLPSGDYREVTIDSVGEIAREEIMKTDQLTEEEALEVIGLLAEQLPKHVVTVTLR